MKKNIKRIKYGDTTIPFSFKTDILQRAIGDNELKVLYGRYAAARLKERLMTPPTPTQYKLAQEYKTTKNAKLTAVKFHVTLAKVYSTSRRVAFWEYFNN